ncbi:MAG: T9SS type A sorting domain-containing protein [Dysgonamonadaceae bacterium]|nr:T9SS type A sorting domain-containing protein [Dysgonamonadaceae bacterium]
MKKIIQFLCLVFALSGFQSVSAQVPTVAAPTPAYNVEANFVRSLYNSTQTYNDVTSFVPAWGQKTRRDFSEAGSDGECMVLYDLDFFPLQIDKPFNLRDDVKYVHVDFYANENTDFRIGFQSWADGEIYFPTLKYTTPGQWYSVDFPIQLIVDAGLGDYKNAIVLRIGGGEEFVYANEIYFDNVYAYDGEPQNLYVAEGPAIPVETAPIPTIPVANVLSFLCSSEVYPDATELTVLNWGQTTIWDYAEVGVDGYAAFMKNLNYLGLNMKSKQDISEYDFVHFDVYCGVETPFQFGWQGYAGATEETYAPSITVTPGKWNSIDIPLSSWTEQGFDLRGTNVIRLGGGSTLIYANEIYIDNIYVYKGSVSGINKIEPVVSKVYTTAGGIIVNTNESVAVYGVDGRLIKKTIANGNNTIALTRGLYLVKVGTDKAVKVVVK